MLCGFAVATVALVAAALAPTAGVIAVVSAAMGMQAAMVSVSSTAAVGDYVREEERHLIFAGTNAWGYLATGLTMVGSQLLRHTYGAFTPSLLVFAGFYAACGVLVVRMRGALQRERAALQGERAV
jgi:MFS family permease